MRSLLVALLILPSLAAASPLPDFPFVYVYGSAKREVTPDRASISFHVKTYDANAERAYRQQSEVAGAVIDFAKKIGLASDDITGQAIEKRAVRRTDDHGNDQEIIGYECVRSVAVQVKDLALFPKLIDFLYSQAHVERLDTNFGCKDADTILQSLTDEACKAATENAERLSKGFRKKLASVRAISENGFSGLGSAFGVGGGQGAYGATTSTARSDDRDFRVIPATINFQKGIYAIFAIE